MLYCSVITKMYTLKYTFYNIQKPYRFAEYSRNIYIYIYTVYTVYADTIQCTMCIVQCIKVCGTLWKSNDSRRRLL